MLTKEDKISLIQNKLNNLIFHIESLENGIANYSEVNIEKKDNRLEDLIELKAKRDALQAELLNIS